VHRPNSPPPPPSPDQIQVGAPRGAWSVSLPNAKGEGQSVSLPNANGVLWPPENAVAFGHVIGWNVDSKDCLDPALCQEAIPRDFDPFKCVQVLFNFQKVREPRGWKVKIFGNAPVLQLMHKTPSFVDKIALGVTQHIVRLTRCTGGYEVECIVLSEVRMALNEMITHTQHCCIEKWSVAFENISAPSPGDVRWLNVKRTIDVEEWQPSSPLAAFRDGPQEIVECVGEKEGEGLVYRPISPPYSPD